MAETVEGLENIQTSAAKIKVFSVLKVFLLPNDFIKIEIVEFPDLL